MAKMTFRIKGDKELIRKLQKYQRQSPKACGAALYQEGNDIMAESIPQTPIDLGPLRASGHVQLPEIKGNSILVRLGFGGAAAAYALKQHEDLTLRHDVGKAKYLEDPVMDAAPGMGQRLAQRIRAFLVRQ